ncbi:M15 family metallopeptidase domain-containing protein [Aliiglaciecola lipolytica]|uniref:Uncharacterized protein n=1 Tax=Aliiglaciecola lipolytica E3 TaxID=1127673 RepID=K6Y7J4_9ALTE|nr:hypothetical protein [Aliiglaciecola lipolytica]GAC14187.1 hypothetical protein GLIP_1553 [Aliiglaciecola lipolytica E3]
MAFDTDLNHLHPVVRDKVKNVIASLERHNIPLKLLEGYRSPVRQEELHNQGATEPPWKSPLQYGLGCVFAIDEEASQDQRADASEWWNQLSQFAEAAELEVSNVEKSQLISPRIDVKKLFKGHYPEGGDESWAKNLEVHITYWNKYPKPPVPNLSSSQDRPFSPQSERDEKSTQ